jgi:hypothetical protein
MTTRQRIVLLIVSALIVGCETVATTGPSSSVDNPGQTAMKDSL